MGRGSGGYYIDEEGAARARAIRDEKVSPRLRARLAALLDGDEVLAAAEAESGWSPWPSILDGGYWLYTRRYHVGVSKDRAVIVRRTRILSGRFLLFDRQPHIAKLADVRILRRGMQQGWLQAELHLPRDATFTLKFEPAWRREAEDVLTVITAARKPM